MSSSIVTVQDNVQTLMNRVSTYLHQAKVLKKPDTSKISISPLDVYDNCRQLSASITHVLTFFEDDVENAKALIEEWKQLVAALIDEDEKKDEGDIFRSKVKASRGYESTLSSADVSLTLLKGYQATCKQVIDQISATQAARSANITMDAPVADQQAPVESTQVEEVKPTQPNFSLPPLKLLTFGGDYVQFAQFITNFRSSVHEKPIPNSAKFAYLLGQLTGVAKEAVDGLSLSGENYLEALQILEDRFGDRNLLLQNLHTQLRTLPAAGSSTQSVRTTYEGLNKICRLLKQLGESPNHPQIQLLIEQKMPHWLLIRLQERKITEPVWTVTDTLQFINQCLKIREYASLITPQTNDQPNKDKSKSSGQNKNKNQNQRFNRSASQTFAAQTNSSPKPDPKCSFCAEAHWTPRCERYATLAARRQRANALKLCIKCLRSGHKSKECGTKKSCYSCRDASHNTALCPNPKTEHAKRDTNALAATTQPPANVNLDWELNCCSVSDKNRQSLLIAADAQIIGPEQTITASAFLDLGSQSHFVTEKLVNKLNLKPTTPAQISLQTLGGIKKQLSTHCYEVKVKDAEGLIHSINAICIPLIVDSLRTGKVLGYRDHKEIEWITTVVQPDLLIGAQNNFIRKITQLNSGYDLVHTRLGPIVAGSPKKISESTGIVAAASTIGSDSNNPAKNPSPFKFASSKEDATNPTQLLWNLEALGIADNPHQDDDAIAMEHFKSTVTRDPEGRFEVAWPWRETGMNLLSHYPVCLKRLVSNWNTLRLKPDRLMLYHKIFEQQLAEGIIEEVPIGDDDGFIRYLPHHGVFRADKQKWRIVFNASNTVRTGDSLNRQLFPGKNLIPDLCGMLLRARLHKIIMFADIKSAFLSVALRKADRNAVRFLWLRDPTKPPEGDNIMHLRFTRICFGAAPSPWLLNVSIQKLLEESGLAVAKELLNTIYIDNLMFVASSVEEGLAKIEQLKRLFESAKFELHEFFASNPQINQHLNETVPETIKLFGVYWQFTNDTFTVKFPEALNPLFTKRILLRQLASVFDPLGFTCPALLSAKRLYQQVCAIPNLKWDTPLDKVELLDQYQKLAINFGQSLTWPRFTNIDLSKPFTLHIFSDASALAFGICAYLSQFDEHSGTSKSALIMAKSLVTPTKAIVMPRLELIAAVLASKLTDFLLKELRLGDIPVIHWIDSQAVLYWIHAESIEKQPRFVVNRLDTLRSHLSKRQYRFVVTSDNPSDIATRGLTLSELQTTKIWFEGPKWLKSDPANWPDSPHFAPPTSIQVFAALKVEAKPEPPFENWISLTAKRVSNYTRLFNTVHYVFTFLLKTAKNKVFERLATFFQMGEGNLPANLIYKFIVKAAQSEYPPNEKLIQHWHLYEDAGVYRQKSRLVNSGLANSEIFPVFLPRWSRITHLIILHFHVKNGHCGRDATVAALRKHFCMPKIHAQVKLTLKNNCMYCCKRSAVPFGRPIIPPLPMERSAVSAPFTFVGTDYFGPVMLKGNKKIWVLLTTCTTTRLVAAFVTKSTSAKNTFFALRKTFALFGTPQKIYSDQAAYFKSVSKFFAPAIKWQFSVPYSPWSHGFYERLVGVVKSVLKATIGHRRLNFEEYDAFLHEAMLIVNSRPLYASEESVVRPIDLMTPQFRLPQVGIVEEPEYLPRKEISTAEMQEILHQNALLQEKFWSIWTGMYLKKLRDAYQTLHKDPFRTANYAPKIGQLVLLAEESSRSKWPLAVIKQVHPTETGKIRSVTLKLKSGRFVQRPVIQLYPLEMAFADMLPIPEEPPSESETKEEQVVDRKPRYKLRNRLVYFAIHENSV